MILLETNNRVVEESISVRIKNALAGYVTLCEIIPSPLRSSIITNYCYVSETNRKTQIYIYRIMQECYFTYPI